MVVNPWPAGQTLIDENILNIARIVFYNLLYIEREIMQWNI